MKQKMEKKKAVTTGVQKPPPVKKSPNGIQARNALVKGLSPRHLRQETLKLKGLPST